MATKVGPVDRAIAQFEVAFAAGLIEAPVAPAIAHDSLFWYTPCSGDCGKISSQGKRIGRPNGDDVEWTFVDPARWTCIECTLEGRS